MSGIRQKEDPDGCSKCRPVTFRSKLALRIARTRVTSARVCGAGGDFQEGERQRQQQSAAKI